MGRAGKLAFALWTTIHGFACTSDAASVEFFIVDGYEFSSEERCDHIDRELDRT